MPSVPNPSQNLTLRSLAEAARDGNLDSLKKLVTELNDSAFDSDINVCILAENSDLLNPLMAACYNGSSETVETLLANSSEGCEEGGLQVDLSCKSPVGGRTALMWAAIRGHADCIRILCRNADKCMGFRLRCREGKTAIDHAVQHNHEECIKALVDSMFDNMSPYDFHLLATHPTHYHIVQSVELQRWSEVQSPTEPESKRRRVTDEDDEVVFTFRATDLSGSICEVRFRVSDVVSFDNIREKTPQWANLIERKIVQTDTRQIDTTAHFASVKSVKMLIAKERGLPSGAMLALYEEAGTFFLLIIHQIRSEIMISFPLDQALVRSVHRSFGQVCFFWGQAENLPGLKVS